jgi:NAD(P)-dependent dehydrogenase (short-subunit alcohol dehydrogenase family)
MSMKDQTVLVTGAQSGIGLEVTRRLLREGARVVATGRQPEATSGGGADSLAESLAEFGESALYLPLDVTSDHAWQQAIAAANARFGALHALVNNAGFFLPGIPFEDMSAGVWRTHLEVNLTGSFLGCQHALRTMRTSGGGSIVNVSSGLAEIMFTEAAAYCVSKAAVLTLTRVAAKAGGRHGVRVNAVLPGAIETPMMWRNLLPGQDREALRAIAVATHPIGRTGQPEDVAKAILFLCDPASSFITGALLAVDGGQMVD